MFAHGPLQRKIFATRLHLLLPSVINPTSAINAYLADTTYKARHLQQQQHQPQQRDERWWTNRRACVPPACLYLSSA